MIQQNIKQLETELWDAADDLRANSKLTAAEYKDPLLGLVLINMEKYIKGFNNGYLLKQQKPKL
ncbi:Type I restriction-modification system, DNA-methyltransferase subunit M [Xanthomarina gelatinilytica]|uniref:Type I restriction-modification system, DNA-methyltransferase subunit M n=1 Tax=Xanthomarina gelatinilytica TaxID=1137281 RepID=M7N0D3_9FLAO|nr:type I restriction-modification system subunit M N-terminal domain-containing protein [Xanthomarina gelatinilytica]EMQ95204.1 Type I restriction-modification system, DNA-methyltransferase subunit M [Xanthomarina gelatinilytica]MCB0744552.1 hypothetical protein [Ignavibacteriota bacterium]